MRISDQPAKFSNLHLLSLTREELSLENSFQKVGCYLHDIFRPSFLSLTFSTFSGKTTQLDHLTVNLSELAEGIFLCWWMTQAGEHCHAIVPTFRVHLDELELEKVEWKRSSLQEIWEESETPGTRAPCDSFQSAWSIWGKLWGESCRDLSFHFGSVGYVAVQVGKFVPCSTFDVAQQVALADRCCSKWLPISFSHHCSARLVGNNTNLI